MKPKTIKSKLPNGVTVEIVLLPDEIEQLEKHSENCKRSSYGGVVITYDDEPALSGSGTDNYTNKEDTRKSPSEAMRIVSETLRELAGDFDIDYEEE